MLKATLASLILISVALPAFAHPDPKPVTPVAKTATKTLDNIQMPSRVELDAARKAMPDLNGLMGDMMGMMTDKDFTSKMENTAKVFGEQIEKSGALSTTNANGMPDFNALMDTMFAVMGNEDAMGGMLESLTDMASTLEHSVEKHVPNAAQNKP